jgi:hypothetical protein
MSAVTQLAVDAGTSAACQALQVPRASYYWDRRKAAAPAVARLRPSPARALRPAERAAVLARLHEERFQDRSPAAVYATLLDEGEYHCSIRTMHRLLKQYGESRERRDQLTHPPYQKPELLATAPNQLWSWDITKLLGPAKWTYFYLNAGSIVMRLSMPESPWFCYFERCSLLIKERAVREAINLSLVSGTTGPGRGPAYLGRYGGRSGLPVARVSKAICCPSGDQRGVPVTELKWVS